MNGDERTPARVSDDLAAVYDWLLAPLPPASEPADMGNEPAPTDGDSDDDPDDVRLKSQSDYVMPDLTTLPLEQGRALAGWVLRAAAEIASDPARLAALRQSMTTKEESRDG